MDVFNEGAAGGQARGLTATDLPDLVEQPWIANRAAADHQSARAGFREQCQRLMWPVHVAVGQHGAAQFAAGERDQVVAHARPIHLRDRPAVDGDQINGVLLEKAKEGFEHVR